MGDRAWTGIQFSGVMSREVAEGLVELVNDQCNGCSADMADKDGDQNFAVADLLEPYNQFSDDECNYASMDAVEAYCKEFGISYRKTWCAGGEYESGIEVYNAATDEAAECCDVQGMPVIGLDELKRMGYGPAVEWLERFVLSEFETKFIPVTLND